MTKLSPAAQAVRDAVKNDCINPGDKCHIAAAVLRAAEDELSFSGNRACLIDTDDLFKIVHELEAQ